ncbi:MAG TPA: cytochrome b/b6 domain-containing protein [Azospira sp.]|nr:cytochrome b/b6 domain-containing protein [Azospira sp.]
MSGAAGGTVGGRVGKESSTASAAPAGARYALPAILLHWLQAALVLWLLWLGWSMVELPKGAERSAAYALHKSLGIVALGLVLLRLVVRRLAPPPAPLAAGPEAGREAALARAAHRLLYVLLLVLPLAGYLASSFTPYAMKFFGIELPRLGWPDEALNALFKRVHWVAGWALVALLALHIAAALRHALRGDGTLSRMLPGRLSRN